ncbi:MAG: aspartyl/glutamyl-tRNA amidotransferase subunit A [Spirochaetaceae bacterium]|jgi:aspartyl-tRNA(Asn)/glutamyl-tRNA(Gln) amidotransferase subunit A|nr:aspartyl/glutamyl-tRNA amidotransferase subunit A [Spirochaetaceae bacterium]
MSDYKEYFDSWEAKIGSFIEVKEEDLTQRRKDAKVFAVKDNIAVKGMSISCGSKLLQHLKAPYTATAVQNLIDAGYTPVGKTNLDEFGMGSSTDNSGIQQTNNPWDASRVAGGSSGGSAAAVAAGLVPFALGSDTGGSIRQPAAFCGCVGLKPTYGAVSRFGLTAYASSLEVVGLCADSVGRTKEVFGVMKGADPMDQTTYSPPPAPPASGRGVTGKKIAALKIASGILDSAIQKGFDEAKKNLRDLGYTIEEIDIPALQFAAPAYYTIATAEASANLARFDGVRYGKRPDWAENPDELVEKTRDEGFGDEVKLRILLGTFVLRSGFQDRYYLKAQKIRAGIKEAFEKVLADKAAILMPVFPTQAFGRGEAGLSAFAQKAADIYTCCANLAGLPGLSFPVGVENGLPVGMQLLGAAFDEDSLFGIAGEYEAAHPFPHPEGWKDWWK